MTTREIVDELKDVRDLMTMDSGGNARPEETQIGERRIALVAFKLGAIIGRLELVAPGRPSKESS